MEIRVKGEEIKMEGFKEFLVDAYGFKDKSGISCEVAVKTYNKVIEPFVEVGGNFFDVVEDAEKIHNLIDSYVSFGEDLTLNEMLNVIYSNYIQSQLESEEEFSKTASFTTTHPENFVGGLPSDWINQDFNYSSGVDEGYKESDGKAPYEELDWNFVDSMAHRMAENTKYGPDNWKKPMNVKNLAAAAMRHARAILEPSEYDTESQQVHAVALGCNGMMINYQLKD